jgi:hypothetical protein
VRIRAALLDSGTTPVGLDRDAIARRTPAEGAAVGAPRVRLDQRV